MALSIGIVGLPNALMGKSPFQRADQGTERAGRELPSLLHHRAQQATVPVPDRRIDALVDLVHRKND